MLKLSISPSRKFAFIAFSKVYCNSDLFSGLNKNYNIFKLKLGSALLKPFTPKLVSCPLGRSTE